MANAAVVVAMFIQFLYNDEEVLALFLDESNLFFYLARIILNHKDNVVASTYATLAILGAFRVNNSLPRSRHSETLKRIRDCSNLTCFIRALKQEAEVFYEKGETMCKEEDALLILRSIVAQRALDCFQVNSTRADDLSRDMWIFGSDHHFGWSTHQSLTPIDHDSGKKFYFEVFHLSLGSLRVGIAHQPTEKHLANWFDLAAFKGAITFDAFEKIHWVYGKERTCTGMSRPEREGYVVGVTIDTTARSSLELIQFTVNGVKVESDPPVSGSRHFPYSVSSKKRKTAPLWHQPYYVSFATSALQSCIVLRNRETWTYADPLLADQLTEVDCQFVRIISNLNPKSAACSSPPQPPAANGPFASQATGNFGIQESQYSAAPALTNTTEPPRPKYHFVLRNSKRCLQKMIPQQQQQEQQHQQLELEQDQQQPPQEYKQEQVESSYVITIDPAHILPDISLPSYETPCCTGEQILIQSAHESYQNQSMPQGMQSFQQVYIEQPSTSTQQEITLFEGFQSFFNTVTFQPSIPLLDCDNSAPSTLPAPPTQPTPPTPSPVQSDSSLLQALGSPLSQTSSQISLTPPYVVGEPPLFVLSPSNCSSPSSQQSFPESTPSPRYQVAESPRSASSVSPINAPPVSPMSALPPPPPMSQRRASSVTSRRTPSVTPRSLTSKSQRSSPSVSQRSAVVSQRRSPPASTSAPSPAPSQSNGQQQLPADIPPPLDPTLDLQPDSPLPPVEHLQQIQFQANRQHFNKSREKNRHSIYYTYNVQNILAELSNLQSARHNQQTAQQTAQQLAQQTAQQLAQQMVQQPAQQPIQQPVQQSFHQPFQQPIQQPVMQPAQQLIQQPMVVQPTVVTSFCIIASDSAPHSISQPIVSQPGPAVVQASSQDESSVVRRTFDDLQARDPQTAQSSGQSSSHVPETTRAQNGAPLPRTGYIQTEHGIISGDGSKSTKIVLPELTRYFT